MMTSDHYGNGEFEFVKENFRDLFKNAHNAITCTEQWCWLAKYEPGCETGFQFAMTPEIRRINDKMHEDPISENHSGSTYGFTMRVMQYIATNGYEKFREKYLRENSVETH
jgi:hypothetical protein